MVPIRLIIRRIKKRIQQLKQCCQGDSPVDDDDDVAQPAAAAAGGASGGTK